MIHTGMPWLGRPSYRLMCTRRSGQLR